MTQECHTHTPLYLLLHPAGFTYLPDPSSRGSSQWSFTDAFHHRQTVRNRKTSKQESEASSRDFRELALAVVGNGA